MNFNTRWYLKPEDWNNTERSPSPPASPNSPKKNKGTSNSILSKIVKEAEKSQNVWDKVSIVEQKIKDAIESKETHLRDNLIDFFR